MATMVEFRYHHGDQCPAIIAVFIKDYFLILNDDKSMKWFVVWKLPERMLPISDKIYQYRRQIKHALDGAPLSVQAALLDPRGPEVGLKELAAKFASEIDV